MADASILAHISKLPRDPQLTSEERDQLKRMCQPGAPLFKILQSALDYADHLKDHIAEAELCEGHPDLPLARQLQLKRKAILSFLDYLAVQIHGPAKQKENTNGSV